MASRNYPTHPPQSGERHGGGGGEYHQGGGGGGRGGRRRPYPDDHMYEQRNTNFNDRRGPADGRPVNDWGPGYHQQHHQQQRFDSSPPNYHGRGGGRSGWGGGRPSQPDNNNHYQQRSSEQQNHHHHHRNNNNDPKRPLPPDERKTLVLANVPPHIKHFHIKAHFNQNWGAPVNYAHIDKTSGLAYVRFDTVDDAKRVWAVGTNGLDGPNNNATIASGGEQSSSSLVSEGVVLQEVYYTNYIPVDKRMDDKQSTPSSRKHGRDTDEYGDRNRQGGATPYHDNERAAKMSRRDSDQNYSSSDHHMKQPPTSASSVNQSNNSYHRGAGDNKKELTPEELELQKQKQEEYQKQYEAFQKEEQEWRKRRNAEYQAFVTAKNERTAQISTLQQKKDLQSKQEAMLAKQLPLHKKMLSMLKSKDAPASEQSKKMKEILSTQTQLLELKKEMKSTVEELEKLKEEERLKGVFAPSEKRPVFAGAGTGKRSLDRRSKTLRVVGFGGEDELEGEEVEAMKTDLKEHFSVFGAVSEVTLEKDDTDDSDGMVALVRFSTRVDAQKAMEGTTFKEVTLKCSWHHGSSSSTPGDDGDDNDIEGDDAVDSVAGADETNLDDNIYNDVEESYGDYIADQGLPAGEEHDMVDYDYGGDEDMVDYD